MHIFPGGFLPAYCNPFHKPAECAPDCSKPVFLRIWGTGLRAPDGGKRLFQLPVRAPDGTGKPESCAGRGRGSQHRGFRRV